MSACDRAAQMEVTHCFFVTAWIRTFSVVVSQVSEPRPGAPDLVLNQTVTNREGTLACASRVAELNVPRSLPGLSRPEPRSRMHVLPVEAELDPKGLPASRRPART